MTYPTDFYDRCVDCGFFTTYTTGKNMKIPPKNFFLFFSAHGPYKQNINLLSDELLPTTYSSGKIICMHRVFYELLKKQIYRDFAHFWQFSPHILRWNPNGCSSCSDCSFVEQYDTGKHFASIFYAANIGYISNFSLL